MDRPGDFPGRFFLVPINALNLTAEYAEEAEKAKNKGKTRITVNAVKAD